MKLKELEMYTRDAIIKLSLSDILKQLETEGETLYDAHVNNFFYLKYIPSELNHEQPPQTYQFQLKNNFSFGLSYDFLQSYDYLKNITVL